MKRFLQRGLVALACVALVYGMIDLWDRLAWNRYRRDYEAHVGPLDYKAYIPKPIPDEQNFAATPCVKFWFTRGPNVIFDRDAFFSADRRMSQCTNLPPGRHFEDLVAWQEAFASLRSHAKKPEGGFQSENLDLASRQQAAPAVLQALQEDGDILEELRTASARPAVCYPMTYNMENPGRFPLRPVVRIRQACQRLRVRACAELTLGRGDEAVEDVKLMMFLADTLKPDPYLLSYLIRLNSVRAAIQVIWEGLADHDWTAGQLEQLQACLEPHHFLADFQGTVRGMHAEGVAAVDWLKKKGLGSFGELGWMAVAPPPDNHNTKLDWWGRIIPSGWYDREKLNFCQLYDGRLEGGMDGTRVFPRRLAANAAKWKARPYGLWNIVACHEILATLMSPRLDTAPSDAAMIQTANDQALLACALERYRLARGQFPDTLQALVPGCLTRLPNDVINGEPYHYRRTGDGRFILYSVGWNETDDGGVAGKEMFDTVKGDWLW